MTDLQNITNVINKNLPDLRGEFPVFKIGIFGSYIHGNASPKSDVDILVDLSKPISMFRFLDLEEKLSEILGVKVDLVTPGALKSAIKDEVLSEVVYV